MRVLSVLVAVLFVLAPAACGASPEGPSEEPGSKSSVGTAATTIPPAPQVEPPADVIEPASLISKDEAEGILGKSLDTVETLEQERVGLKQCLYGSGDDLFQIGFTQQAMMPAGQTQTPEDLYRAIVENFEDAVEVEGIGDEAYLATPGLHILYDGYYIVIALGNLSDENNREKLKEAGTLAVANLRAMTR